MENVDLKTGVKALGEYLLVKQTMVKKKSKLILDASKDEKAKFDINFEVIQLGDKCTSSVQVGDAPIFEEYVKFNMGIVLQKTEDVMISLLLVHQNSVIGIYTNLKFETILN